MKKAAWKFKAPNKNIMMGILLAAKALLKSPYVKCYMPRMLGT
jgi:hypothetical protein